MELEAYLTEFSDIPKALKDRRCVDGEKTLSKRLVCYRALSQYFYVTYGAVRLSGAGRQLRVAMTGPCA